jgi:hypothetical protein
MASADIAGGGVGLVGIGGGGGSGGGVGDVPPSPTLYVQNLTEKVRKAALKTSLYAIFSPFGRVVQIVHCRSKELRGQAWVVFGDVASATAAMAKMQSYPLFDKPMVRVQTRNDSDFRRRVFSHLFPPSLPLLINGTHPVTLFNTCTPYLSQCTYISLP